MDKEVISALRWLAKETEFVFAKEQLEDAANRLDALLAEVKRLNAENEAMQSIARHAEELDEQLAAVTAERDAAVEDINLIEVCDVCKHHICDDCDIAGVECRFEWRGDRKEQNDGK